jgi:parvulin-like peptidyl-prolyl isomerase
MYNISKEKLASWGLLKKFIFEQTIDKKVINISIDNSSIKSILEDWIRSKNIKSNQELEKWKKDNGFDDANFTDYVLRSWKWNEWCKKEFENEIPSYYLKRKPLLDVLTYSLLRVKNQNLALELYLRIKEKESTFKDIANKYSEGKESSNGGIIGPVSINNVHPLLAKLLQVSKKDQLWKPRKIENWWVVVRLEEIRNTELNDQIKNMLSLELGNNFLNKEFGKLIEVNKENSNKDKQLLSQ